MSRSQRLGMLGLALVVLVAAFALLRPTDDDTGEPREALRPTPTSTPTPGPRRDGEPTPTATPEDRSPLLVADRVQRIEVRKGDHVRLRARSTRPDEVHVHGYDILRDLAPGKTVSLDFDADIEGIFEIEFEKSGTEVGNLVVTP